MLHYSQAIAYGLPLYYLIDGLNNIMVYGNYDGAFFDLGVVAVITLIIFFVAVKLFMWRED